MINKIKEYINKHQLIPPGVKTIYTAVSGGIDSCVMLDVLYHLRSEYGYDLVVLHYNHNTRGAESLGDEQFVEDLAKRYQLKIILGRLRGKPLKVSETYLREQRLKFFEKTVVKNPDIRIATGHNLNDNIETFLMRMAKGSRVKGLLGIKPCRGYFIRPLLQIDRNSIISYAKKNNLTYREDSTNRDVAIIRNNIRHRIIPYLEAEFSTDLTVQIPKIIDDLYKYYDIYEEKLSEVIQNITKKTKTGISLHRKRYLLYNETLRRGLLEYCISSVYPVNYKISDRNLALWDDFISDAQVGKKMLFLENGMAVVERQFIMFGKSQVEKSETIIIRLGESVEVLDSYQISFEKIEKEKIKFTNDKAVEYIDGDKSGELLQVRFWKKGDSFQPLGMSNKRKLSDFFTDLKINTFLKKSIPLICKGDRIIWIAGYRLDDQFKISPETKTVFKLELVSKK